MVKYTPQLTLAPLSTSDYVLPLGTCTAANITLPSPVVTASIYPASNPAASAAVAEYLSGK